MAEGGSSSSKGFAKVFTKKVTRTKEKVFQSLGKGDRTKDEAFDEHVANLNKQCSSASKLQKELKNYISTVKAMSNASKSYYESIKDSYETEWTGYTELVSAVEQLSSLWDNYLETLQENLNAQLHEYIGRFPEVKKKIDKRGRKLVDFDSARHNLSSQENAKKPDQLKIQKAQEELNEAKRIYEELNNELHQELPALYDSRISFLSSHYNNLFQAECKFQEESARLKSSLVEVTDNLMKESGREHGIFQLNSRQPNIAITSVDRRSDTDSDGSKVNGDDGRTKGLTKFYNVSVPNEHETRKDQDASPNMQLKTTPKGSSSESPAPTPSPKDLRYQDENENEKDKVADDEDEYLVPPNNRPVSIQNGTVEAEEVKRTSMPDSPREQMYEPVTMGAQLNDADAGESSDSPDSTPAQEEQTSRSEPEKLHEPDISSTEPAESADQAKMEEVKTEEVKAEEAKTEEVKTEEGETKERSLYCMAEDTDDIYTVPSSNECVEKLPPGVLYQVVATHPYNGEDVDELTFETGDTINVIAFDDPDDQDEGWLMGIKVGAKEKGVFPENFTKRI